MTHDESTAVSNRREWGIRLLRYGTLGGIAAMVTYLVGRQWVNGCPLVSSHCTSCQLFSRCELPLAQSVREAHTRKEQT